MGLASTAALIQHDPSQPERNRKIGPPRPPRGFGREGSYSGHRRPRPRQLGAPRHAAPWSTPCPSRTRSARCERPRPPAAPVCRAALATTRDGSDRTGGNACSMTNKTRNRAAERKLASPRHTLRKGPPREQVRGSATRAPRRSAGGRGSRGAAHVTTQRRASAARSRRAER